jgi:hypothetical protein
MLSKCGSYKDYGSRGPCRLSRNRGHSFIHIQLLLVIITNFVDSQESDFIKCQIPNLEQNLFGKIAKFWLPFAKDMPSPRLSWV